MTASVTNLTQTDRCDGSVLTLWSMGRPTAILRARGVPGFESWPLRALRPDLSWGNGILVQFRCKIRPAGGSQGTKVTRGFCAIRRCKVRINSFTSRTKHLPYFAGEIVHRKGLRDEGIGGSHSCVGDRLGGISGHEQHLHAWVGSLEAVCQLTARHLGHHYVSQQQVNGTGVCLGHPECRLAIGCFQHVIAFPPENIPSQFAHPLIIIHNQKRLHPIESPVFPLGHPCFTPPRTAPAAILSDAS